MFVDEKYKNGDSNDADMIKFTVCGGEIKVLWVKGLDGLAKLLVGTTVLGFLPRVIDGILSFFVVFFLLKIV